MQVAAVGVVVLALVILVWLAWRYRPGTAWFLVPTPQARFVGEHTYEILVQVQQRKGSAIWVQSWVPIDALQWELVDSFGHAVWIKGSVDEGVDVKVTVHA